MGADHEPSIGRSTALPETAERTPGGAPGPGSWGTERSRTASIEFDRGPQVVSDVRHFVGDVVRSWGFRDLSPVCELLATEMITHVAMAGPPGTPGGSVTLAAMPSGVRVEIADASPPDPPHLPGGSAGYSEGALAMLDEFARQWGLEWRRGVAVSWFELDDGPP